MAAIVKKFPVFRLWKSGNPSWATDWQLPISYSKCCIFDLSNKPFSHKLLAIDAVNIPFVKEVVDLGVTMDKQEAQLPLRNRASATYFFAAKLISIASNHPRSLRPIIR